MKQHICQLGLEEMDIVQIIQDILTLLTKQILT